MCGKGEENGAAIKLSHAILSLSLLGANASVAVLALFGLRSSVSWKTVNTKMVSIHTVYWVVPQYLNICIICMIPMDESAKLAASVSRVHTNNAPDAVSERGRRSISK